MAESAGYHSGHFKGLFHVCLKMALDENTLQKVQETAVDISKGCFMCV